MKRDKIIIFRLIGIGTDEWTILGRISLDKIRLPDEETYYFVQWSYSIGGSSMQIQLTALENSPREFEQNLLKLNVPCAAVIFR